MTDSTSLKKALLMIQKLKKLLQEKQHQLFEPVAIIGMGCRLPQANHLHAFWDLLCQGNQVISPIPDERWELLKGTREAMQRDINQPYWGGYLEDIAAFDAYFFGISPREAIRMDPQQRLLLETTYASFEDAGLTAEQLAGTNTGVFSSLYSSQYGHLQSQDADEDALLIPTGSAVSIAANRLSYLFDLHGPSMTIDTACSSSLIAVQMACLNLQAKLCDQAIVNAVNINLLPSVHTLLTKATMLSPTGKCQTFDANANGYVQGEGACSIILKPLSKALKDNDKIYAVIAGGAINQDGKTNGLTAPNGKQQEQLLHSAYRSAKVDPKHIAYIECHGTGTFLGDPIEAQALGEVIGKHRPKHQPCWISSVKTNVGHLEPAAGLVSIIKVALALKHNVIPPHLHFKTPNPHIAFDQYGFNIPQQMELFPKYGDVRIAGVSGFGGANAHLVLRELTEQEQSRLPCPITPSSTPNLSVENNAPNRDSARFAFKNELFTLSAKDPEALQTLVERWCQHINQHHELHIAQLCYNTHLKRPHYSCRIGILTDSTEDLYQKLIKLRASPQTTDEFIYTTQNHQNTKKNNLIINTFETMDLNTLAKHYVQQATVNWQAYEAHRSYPIIDMPLYPWQHKQYWPIFSEKQEIATSTYPLRGRLLSSPLSAHQFEFIADTIALPEMLDTFYVLHAGYYAEILHYAMQQLSQNTCFHIDNLTFSSPLVVPPNKKVFIQLILNPIDDKSFSFTLYSHDGSNHWIEHAKGTVFVEQTTAPIFNMPTDLRLHHTDEGTLETFYERILTMGMPAGDTVRWINHYWLQHQNILCELRTSKPTDRIEQFAMNIHPGLIDACIQTLFLMLPTEINKPYVTSHMGRISFYGNLNEATYVYANLKEVSSQDQRIIGHWYLLNQNYQIIATCEDISLSQLGNSMSIDKVIDLQSRCDLDVTQPYPQCKQRVQEHLIQQIGLIFSMPVEDIPIDRSLLELGMDSLMALAVIRMVETSFNVTLSLPKIMGNMSIEDIATFVLKDHYNDLNKTENQLINKQETIWIFNRKPQKEAQVRLFCFPFGGSGASIYRDWQHDFPNTIEVCPVQLPGRENRMEEAAIHDMDTLVSTLTLHLQPLLDKPFAFFGHSLGALIAFELTRYLRAHDLPQPVHLFASAYPDPRKPSKSLERLLNELEEQQLHFFNLSQATMSKLDNSQLTILATILKKNGLVDYGDARLNQDIINVLLPIFINDMRLAKQHCYRHEKPLELPITAFFGQQDTWVSPEDIQGWAAHSTIDCEFQPFESGHLFIKEKEIRSNIIKKITRMLSTKNLLIENSELY